MIPLTPKNYDLPHLLRHPLIKKRNASFNHPIKINLLLTLFLFTIILGCKQLNDTRVARKTLPGWNFEKITIDSTFNRGYQVTSADFNGDGKPDIAAVSDRENEVIWYENPTWEPHIISNSTTSNIDLAPYDINADGHIDLALACRFALGNSLEGGYVYWLENPGSTDKLWEKVFIDSIPTTHRIRWADVDGNGKPELINLPIIGIGAEAPEYDVSLDMVSYKIPENPKTDIWAKTVIDSSLHMAHGISVEQFTKDDNPDILTASFEGVMLYTFSEKEWQKKHVGAGDASPRPKQGASEVSLGYLGKKTTPFIATIEPWHGHQVVVYTPRNDENELWKREIIDTTFVDGHALRCADLNNDGLSEIIAGHRSVGHRGEGYNLYIFQYDAQNKVWLRYPLDEGGMSAAGLFIVDVDEDGYADIAASGSRTNNVVLYRNLMGKSSKK